MENDRLGKAISFLRKRKGYTQRELSEFLDISDKAVSKWERGLSYPDISLLAKLSILLDTDIESLLQGNISHCSQTWRGVMIFRDTDGISLITQIYDKPLVYYLLSYFLLVGIKEILILCSAQEKRNMEELLGNGERMGICLIYQIQDQTREWEEIWRDNRRFISGYHIMVMYGKKFLYGMDLTKIFQRAMSRENGITLLTTQNKYGANPKKLLFDMNRRVLSANSTDQKYLQESYHTIPVLFCTSGMLEKLDFDKSCSLSLSIEPGKSESFYAEVIGRGIVQSDLKSWDDIVDMAAFVKTVQKHQNEYIACVEEIAWRRGLITKKELKMLGDEKASTEYGDYIRKLCNKE